MLGFVGGARLPGRLRLVLTRRGPLGWLDDRAFLGVGRVLV
jgi:hypothetical protein